MTGRTTKRRRRARNGGAWGAGSRSAVAVVAMVVAAGMGWVVTPGYAAGGRDDGAEARAGDGVGGDGLGRAADGGAPQQQQALSLVEVGEEPATVEEVLLPWDHIRLTAMSCQEGPTYSRFTPANMDFITPAEQCNTCDSVVTNMNRWNWQRHYSSLCVGVPRHLVDLCKHYACKMAIQCPEFSSNKCVVDGYERFPCPAKYLCWNCLGIPKQQIAGCFDGTAAGVA